VCCLGARSRCWSLRSTMPLGTTYALLGARLGSPITRARASEFTGGVAPRAQSQFIFNPPMLHEVASKALAAHPNDIHAVVKSIVKELNKRVPGALHLLAPSSPAARCTHAALRAAQATSTWRRNGCSTTPAEPWAPCT